MQKKISNSSTPQVKTKTQEMSRTTAEFPCECARQQQKKISEQELPRTLNQLILLSFICYNKLTSRSSSLRCSFSNSKISFFLIQFIRLFSNSNSIFSSFFSNSNSIPDQTHRSDISFFKYTPKKNILINRTHSP